MPLAPDVTSGCRVVLRWRQGEFEMSAKSVMKVGDLARRCGVSVRTLHYYEQIGLLCPSGKTAAGHRIYSAPDVVRLQQVVSLKQLGMSLDEVQKCLSQPRWSALRILKLQIRRLRNRIENEQRLCLRLERLAERYRFRGSVSLSELAQTIKEIVMFDKHFTPEQLKDLHERGEKLGAARIKAVQEEWPLLIRQVRQQMENGADPASDAVQELARRWTSLITEFSGGDAGIERSLGKMYNQQPEVGRQFGLDPAIFAYIGKANAAKGS